MSKLSCYLSIHPSRLLASLVVDSHQNRTVAHSHHSIARLLVFACLRESLWRLMDVSTTANGIHGDSSSSSNSSSGSVKVLDVSIDSISWYPAPAASPSYAAPSLVARSWLSRSHSPTPWLAPSQGVSLGPPRTSLPLRQLMASWCSQQARPTTRLLTRPRARRSSSSSYNNPRRQAPLPILYQPHHRRHRRHRHLHHRWERVTTDRFSRVRAMSARDCAR